MRSIAIFLAAFLSAGNARALTPSSVFLQAGDGEEQTSAYVLGTTWDLPWHRANSFGAVSAYTEASFGRWATGSAPGGSAWVTQIGITPIVRLTPSWSASWFGELGVGANVLAPIYRSGDKRFSTQFNFGDHVAVGKRFGPDNKYELALRFQHFSNAGIREPNPGENFAQLRYTIRI